MANIPLQPQKFSVTIEYCVPCDYSRFALSAAQDLMWHYQHIVDRLAFKMGTKGVFQVTVDNDVLFSKADEARFPEDGEILERFTQLVGQDVARYPHS